MADEVSLKILQVQLNICNLRLYQIKKVISSVFTDGWYSEYKINFCFIKLKKKKKSYIQFLNLYNSI